MVSLCVLDWWDPTINCVPSALWPVYWLPYLFYIHARHRMIEAARREKKWRAAKCPMVSWSLAQWHDVSIALKSKPANQTQSGASKRVPEHFFAGRKFQTSEYSKTVSGLVITLRQRILKLLEVLWRHLEIVSRTGLRMSKVLEKKACFWASLSSAGSQHGNLQQSLVPTSRLSYCRPTRKPASLTLKTKKSWREGCKNYVKWARKIEMRKAEILRRRRSVHGYF